MFQVKLSTDTFACIKDKLSKRNDVKISFGLDNPNYGVIQTHGVQAELVYDPTEEVLTFQNEHLHGLTKLESEESIEEHLLKIANDLGCGEITKYEAKVETETKNNTPAPTDTQVDPNAPKSKFLANPTNSSQNPTSNSEADSAKG